MLRSVHVLFISLTSLCCVAQQTISVKFCGLSTHPGGDPMAHLQPYKLDPNANFVMNFGGFIGYEKFVFEDLVSVKALQGLMLDCSAGWASATHLGVRGRMLKKGKHSVYIGLGPTLVLRESWNRFGDLYESSNFMNESYSDLLGDIQWKLSPIGSEIEYDYAISEKNQLSVSIFPAVPAAIITCIGWKHWIEIKNFPKEKIYIPK